MQVHREAVLAINCVMLAAEVGQRLLQVSLGRLALDVQLVPDARRPERPCAPRLVAIRLEVPL